MSYENSERIFRLPTTSRTRWCRRNSNRRYCSGRGYCSPKLPSSFSVHTGPNRKIRHRRLVVLSESFDLTGGTTRGSKRRAGIEKLKLAGFSPHRRRFRRFWHHRRPPLDAGWPVGPSWAIARRRQRPDGRRRADFSPFVILGEGGSSG